MEKGAYIYDRIGSSYSLFRKADPRIVGSILNLLKLPQESVIADIGAGTGNYARALADKGFDIYAIEPSSVMINQSIPHPHVRYLAGIAENIPLSDGAVDGVISVMSLHHFTDIKKALLEMDRIVGSGPIVILTFDRNLGENFWFTDYFQKVWKGPFKDFPALSKIVDIIEETTHRNVTVSTFMIPHDLSDFQLPAGWRRPEIYLDPRIRAVNSSFVLADPEEVEEAVRELSSDLDSGIWFKKYGDILKRNELDAGYRFLTCR